MSAARMCKPAAVAAPRRLITRPVGLHVASAEVARATAFAEQRLLSNFASGPTRGSIPCRRAASVARPAPSRAPLILVLDIDETLVRVRCDGVHNKRRPLENPCFHMSVDLAVPPKSNVFNCAVVKRPGLDDFLEWIQDRRAQGVIEGPWLFTTSSARYTKSLLKHLDPGGRIFGMRVLARKACTPASLPGFALKDLDRIRPQDSVQRKVLVDNNPVSHVLQPGGAVLVRDWLGENPHDAELARVRALVDDMVACPEAVATGDYARTLTRLTADQGKEQMQQLVRLRERLASSPPDNVLELRQLLTAVSAEANDLKRAVLGAAP